MESPFALVGRLSVVSTCAREDHNSTVTWLLLVHAATAVVVMPLRLHGVLTEEKECKKAATEALAKEMLITSRMRNKSYLRNVL